MQHPAQACNLMHLSSCDSDCLWPMSTYSSQPVRMQAEKWSVTDSISERHAPGVSCLRLVTHAPDTLSLPADMPAPAVTPHPLEASSPAASSSVEGSQDDPCARMPTEDMEPGLPSFVLSPSMLSLAQASGYQSMLALPGATAIMQGEASDDIPPRRRATQLSCVPAALLRQAGRQSCSISTLGCLAGGSCWQPTRRLSRHLSLCPALICMLRCCMPPAGWQGSRSPLC